MTANPVPAPNFAKPIVDEGGYAETWFQWFLRGLYDRTGGTDDKVDAAHGLASNAVPQTTEIVTAGGLKSGGALTGNVGVTLYTAKATVANLPTSGNSTGDWAFATNGRKPGESAGAGTGVPCFWSGSNWFAVTSGAAVTA
jgi:hypothetical protein